MRQSREPTPRQVLQEPDMTENVVSFVPGEGNRPLGIFMDKESEFLSFPTIYCGHTRADNKETY